MKRTGETPQTFAAWLRDRLEQRGYDLSIRGGGRTEAGKAAGISRASIGRMLNGEPVRDFDILVRLAHWLGVPPGEVLVRAGILTREELAAAADSLDTTRPPITPEQAADELGITDPHARRVYLATVDALRTGPAAERQAKQ